MLISVVQEASGMCCPLYGEIACGDLLPAQQVNGGAQCFAQETSPMHVLLEHPLSEREEVGPQLPFPGS